MPTPTHGSKYLALPRDEWDFRDPRVPDGELAACVLYEFARESQEIQRFRYEWHRPRKDQQTFRTRLLRTLCRIEPNLNYPVQLEGWRNIMLVPQDIAGIPGRG